ncbi:MAG: hypothetical protein LQ341_003365 [Variospora aurantia]|nr:MAG: hypothetical protein LQ341_003365 [Variospora aurantia]
MTHSPTSSSALTAVSRLSFDFGDFTIKPKVQEKTVADLDILSHIQHASGIGKGTLRIDSVARCWAQKKGYPDKWRSECYAVLHIGWWLWDDKIYPEYTARWEDPTNEVVRSFAKEECDRLLREFFEPKILIMSSADQIPLHILRTIVLATNWLHMAAEDIALTLTYLYTMKGDYYYRWFDESFVPEEAFEPAEIQPLYNYYQTFHWDDYELWDRNAISWNQKLNLSYEDLMELNSRLIEMPWALESKSKEIDVKTRYTRFFEWFEVAQEWSKSNPKRLQKRARISANTELFPERSENQA